MCLCCSYRSLISQSRSGLVHDPSVSPVIKQLSYVAEEDLVSNETSAGSVFGISFSPFDIKESMSVYCGFVKGKKPGLGTGFDIGEVNLLEMEQCRGVVVASAIFGNYDIMQQPTNISEAAKETACFYMFVDEEIEAYVKNTSGIDITSKVGLWRVVVVRNLPYVDAMRHGKGYHRDLLEQRKALAATRLAPPVVKNETPVKLLPETLSEKVAKPPPSRRRGRDRKSNSRRRHPRATALRELI